MDTISSSDRCTAATPRSRSSLTPPPGPASLVTVLPSPAGTMFTWEERYDSEDLVGSGASYDDGLADIAKHLIERFGGRIVERTLDGPRQ